MCAKRVALVCVGILISTAWAQGAATSVSAREASWQHHQKLKQDSLFRDLKWRSVGPRKQGGRIEAIACRAENPFVIYVGAGAGNLWKTENNGITWKPIFENESTFAIGSIAVAPSDPSIVWLGTGEELMARSSYAGTGVFKSTDGGAAWRNMGLEDTHHIAKVLIHPTDANVVYVAAIGHLYTFNEERGLFKTTNSGESWQKILYSDEKTGCIDLAMDPTDPNTLFAAMWERDRKVWGHVSYGKGSGIYRTTDAGKTWKRLSEGLPSGDHVGRWGVAIAASNPRVVYAICDCKGPDEGVYRSNDRGESWQKVNKDRILAGYDFCEIRVSPDNENEVYVPGVRSFRSTDGGKTYQRIGGTLVHILQHDSKILHLDAHDLWIDPLQPDRLILGSDGGVHFSYDRGKSWLHINTLPIGEFYSIWADMAEPYRIYGGTQDNAALYGPATAPIGDDDEDPWKHVYLDRWGGGDSFFTYPDPTDSDTIYYEHQFGDLKRKNIRTGKTKGIRPRVTRGETSLRWNWMTPFIISRHDGSTLYCGAQRLFKSTDRGDSWVALSPDLSTQPGSEKQGNVPYGTITMIAESPLTHGLLYVGTDDGNVHITRNDGWEWKKINKGLPDLWVSALEASHCREGVVYAALTGYREDDFSAYVYRSTDHGKTWASIAANLPAESINVIREDPLYENILYVGTDLGVYVSIDTGATWQSLCNGLPTTPVHDLFVHSRDSDLIAGTHGRSVFVLEIEAIRKHGIRSGPFVGYEPSTHYTQKAIEGWKVIIHNELLEEGKHAETGKAALKQLQRDMKKVRQCIPDETLEKLLKVGIWLEVDSTNGPHGRTPTFHYHPGLDWLIRMDFHPGKHRCVEYSRAEALVKASARSAGILLHELAHAYHDQILSFEDADILAAYKRAVEGTAYPHRDWIKSDHKEFFAGVTSRYFGTKTEREDLARRDPVLMKKLKQVWGKPKAYMKTDD